MKSLARMDILDVICLFLVLFSVFGLLFCPSVDDSFTTDRSITVYGNGKQESVKGRCDIEEEVPNGNNVYFLLVKCKKENGDIDAKKFVKEGKFPSYEDEVIKKHPGRLKPSIAKRIFGVGYF
jgi:hypothetical protein